MVNGSRIIETCLKMRQDNCKRLDCAWKVIRLIHISLYFTEKKRQPIFLELLLVTYCQKIENRK